MTTRYKLAVVLVVGSVLTWAGGPVRAQQPTVVEAQEPINSARMSPFSRRRIVVGLPTTTTDAAGHVVLEPNVSVDQSGTATLPMPSSGYGPPPVSSFDDSHIDSRPVRVWNSLPDPPPSGPVSHRNSIWPVLKWPGAPRRYSVPALPSHGQSIRAAAYQQGAPQAVEGAPIPTLEEPGNPQFPVIGPDGTVISPEMFPEGFVIAPADPLFADIVGDAQYGDFHDFEMCDECDDCEYGCSERCFGYCSPLRRMFRFHVHKTACDPAIGHERVEFAPFEVDLTQPFNRVQFRIQGFRKMHAPDRATYFWPRAGDGPDHPEISVDYQEWRTLIELGGGRFSMGTELPLRLVDPVVNFDTAGLSDITLTPKMVLIDGEDWQFTHQFRTYIPTGRPKRGLGSGHASLEPALLLRYRWTPATYLHWEWKYWIPIGADKSFAGQVMRYGYGVSTVLHETDTFAIMPTFEIIGWSVLDGQKTLPIGGVVEIDGETFGSIQLGTRFVLGPSGDLGLFELGLGGGWMLANDGFFEDTIKLDLRFSW